MTKKHWPFLVCLNFMILSICSSAIADGFEVFVFNHPIYEASDSVQIDSGFTLLNNFGATQMICALDDRLFELCKRFNLRIIPNNGTGSRYDEKFFGDGDWHTAIVTLDSAKPHYLVDYAHCGAYAATSIENDLRKLGYEWRLDTVSRIGSKVSDAVIDREVNYASVTIDSAGLIFPCFVPDAEFRLPIPNFTPEKPYKMRARMRIGDASGDTSILVARMTIIDLSSDTSFCKPDNENGIHVTEIRNDTLLLYFGDGSVIDSVVPQPGAENLVTNYYLKRFLPQFSSEEQLFDTISHDYSFVYESDTLWQIPYKVTKDITVGQFQGNDTSYVEFTMDCWLHRIAPGACPGYRYEYVIEWFDTRDLYLDSVILFTDTGLTLATFNDEAIADTLDEFVSRWADSAGASSPDDIFGDFWYIGDEVHTMQFATSGILKNIMSKCQIAPKKTITTERPWQVKGMKSDGTFGTEVYRNYYSERMIVDPYPFPCFTDYETVSETDTTSCLYHLNRLCGELDTLKIALNVVAVSDSLEWWYLAQAFDAWSRVDSINNVWRQVFDMPSASGMAAQLNIALAYNATGLGYYTFNGGLDSSATLTSWYTMQVPLFRSPTFQEYVPLCPCDSTLPPGDSPVLYRFSKKWTVCTLS